MSDVKHSFANANTFYILGEFDDELKESIILPLTSKIEELKSQKDAEITLYITSQGGGTWAAMHIVQLLELAKLKGIVVKTVVPTIAYSSGSLVSVAGTQGHRYISHEAEMLIHYGDYSSFLDTTPTQVERESAHRIRHFEKIKKHYEKYSKVPDLAEKIKDNWFYVEAEDCIAWGLADKYMDQL